MRVECKAIRWRQRKQKKLFPSIAMKSFGVTPPLLAWATPPPFLGQKKSTTLRTPTPSHGGPIPPRTSPDTFRKALFGAFSFHKIVNKITSRHFHRLILWRAGYIEARHFIISIYCLGHCGHVAVLSLLSYPAKRGRKSNRRKKQRHTGAGPRFKKCQQ